MCQGPDSSLYELSCTNCSNSVHLKRGTETSTVFTFNCGHGLKQKSVAAFLGIRILFETSVCWTGWGEVMCVCTALEWSRLRADRSSRSAMTSLSRFNSSSSLSSPVARITFNDLQHAPFQLKLGTAKAEKATSIRPAMPEPMPAMPLAWAPLAIGSPWTRSACAALA